MSCLAVRDAPELSPLFVLCSANEERPLDCGPWVSARGRLFSFGEDCFDIAFIRPGSDLLSRVLRRSTIGAGVFHGRVRKGNGCSHPAMTTRSYKGNVD
jgi:hypothetical protein